MRERITKWVWFILASVIAVQAVSALEHRSDSNSDKASVDKDRERRLNLPDRYEIHDARNGNFAGTVLLDRKTGRTWIMAASGEGNSVSQSWQELTAYPGPCYEDPPKGNGGCSVLDPIGK